MIGSTLRTVRPIELGAAYAELPADATTFWRPAALHTVIDVRSSEHDGTIVVELEDVCASECMRLHLDDP